MIVARQQRAKKRVRMWPGSLHRSCNSLRRPGLAAEEQDKSKPAKTIDRRHNISHGNKLYLEQVKQEFKQAVSIELVADASVFGSGDYELFAAYSPDTGKAAFLAPIRLRRLRWRTAIPGEQLDPWAVLGIAFSFLRADRS